MSLVNVDHPIWPYIHGRETPDRQCNPECVIVHNAFPPSRDVHGPCAIRHDAILINTTIHAGMSCRRFHHVMKQFQSEPPKLPAQSLSGKNVRGADGTSQDWENAHQDLPPKACPVGKSRRLGSAIRA